MPAMMVPMPQKIKFKMPHRMAQFCGSLGTFHAWRQRILHDLFSASSVA
jgi:hypothetical protein